MYIKTFNIEELHTLYILLHFFTIFAEIALSQRF